MPSLIERKKEKKIGSIISVDEMQFGFMLGVGTIDDIFVMGQLQENIWRISWKVKNRPSI